MGANAGDLRKQEVSALSESPNLGLLLKPPLDVGEALRTGRLARGVRRVPFAGGFSFDGDELSSVTEAPRLPIRVRREQKRGIPQTWCYLLP